MANFTTTQAYESSSESDNEMKVDQSHIQRKPIARRSVRWVKEKVYSDANDAQNAIKQEKRWSKYYTNKSRDGIKVHYRCNQVPFRGKQCDAAIHLYYPNDSSEVLLFHTDSEHDHANLTQRKCFSEELKQHIDELFDLKLKPKKIYEVLQEKKIMITSNQLKNYLMQLRKKKYGASTINLGNLENLCAENSTVPQSEDETFVLSYHVQYEDDIDDNEDAMDGENKFRFFITTKRLLEIASISTRIHADATYKLNWQGFPVLIIGATDSDRKLHPLGLAVCSNEQQQDFEFIFKSISNGVDQIVQPKFMPEVLIADGADAIRNALKTTFNNDKIVMYWTHMRRYVDKKLSNVSFRQEILDDIDKLQLCESEKVFNKALSLFVKKWSQREHDFLQYFENEWLKTFSSWYEGYNYFIPSTNNSLEATNRVIKDEHTFRERHPLSIQEILAN
ncbi:unnamed protein product [Rotaria sp. Silwood2]|nr:unnamed protein product [Rotaria sp. Silwood2]